MMRRMRMAMWTLLFASALAAVSAPAWSQEQTGNVQGFVKDSQGGVLPGVTVEARSPTRAGAATAVTDDRGTYRFQALPPGEYDVTATLEGFNPAKRHVPVGLGQTLQIDLVLTLGGIQESVTVTTDAPLVDVHQNATAVDFKRDVIEALPNARDFTSILAVAPSANSEVAAGGVSIDGASGAENRFIIDGVDTTETQTGQSGKLYLTDFLDTVQVKSSGYNAEFGGATGGVVNVITKSGTDAWHGMAASYFQNRDLNGAQRPTLRLGLTDATLAESVTYPKDPYNDVEPTLAIGGPLVKDRVFLYTGYAAQVQDTQRTVTFLANQATGTFSSNTRVQYLTTKVSAPWGFLAFNTNPTRTLGTLPNQDGTSDPTYNFTGTGQTTSNISASGEFHRLLAQNLLLSVRGGYFRTNQQSLGIPDQVQHVFVGTNEGLAGVPPDLVQPTGYADVFSNQATAFNVKTRGSLVANTTYTLTRGGEHTFKAGFQMDANGNRVQSGYLKPVVNLYWGQTYTSPTTGVQSTGPYGYYTVTQQANLGEVTWPNLALYAQDQWVLNRLTLNLGLRTEYETIPSYIAGFPSTTFGFEQKLAPRLGFAWDVQGDGRWKLYGSYGIFYDQTKLQLALNNYGGFQNYENVYTLNSPNWSSIGGGACPPACPGTQVDSLNLQPASNDPANNLIDPTLQPMRSHEVTVGLDHQLGPSTSLDVKYLHKALDRAIENEGLFVPGPNGASQQEYFIANPGFGVDQYPAQGLCPTCPAQPPAVRQYDALDVQLRHRLSAYVSVNASYVLSRLYGNYGGLVNSDSVVNTSTGAGDARPYSTVYFDSLLMSFTQNGQPLYGRLATDRPHQFKTQVIWNAPWGTTVAVNQYVASGTPITPTATIGIDPIMYEGRGADGRTPMYSQTDLSVSHTVRLARGQALRVSANVLNLFDQSVVTYVYSTLTYPGQAVPIANFEQFFAGVNIPQIIQANHVLTDPRFLQPSAYQPMRQIWLSVRYAF